MAKLSQRIGGSFAPPLTDDLLAKYQTLINAVPAGQQLRDALNDCMACCRKWWDLPESTGEGTPHLSGRGKVIDLDLPTAEALFDHIPWEEELDTFAKLFNEIDPQEKRDLRNAAFHLLWHVKELNMDREPITTDKL